MHGNTDTRIHNGLETRYILWLQARYGHVITFTGHGCISNGHNTFLSYLLQVFFEDRYFARLTDITFALLKA